MYGVPRKTKYKHCYGTSLGLLHSPYLDSQVLDHENGDTESTKGFIHKACRLQRPLTARCPKTYAPRLCGYCGGAVDSIISNFTHLDWSSFNLEFETLYESI